MVDKYPVTAIDTFTSGTTCTDIMEWGGISVDADEATTGAADDENYEVLVSEASLLEWGVACLCKAGADEDAARTQANILLAADRRGHFSHGFNRLDIYCNDIESRVCKPNLAPVIANETATILV